MKQESMFIHCGSNYVQCIHSQEAHKCINDVSFLFFLLNMFHSYISS